MADRTTSKNNPTTTVDRWRTPIDELFVKLGLPLTTGNKSGSCVMLKNNGLRYKERD